jgi:long-chain acyl-CoA synthetase
MSTGITNDDGRPGNVSDLLRTAASMFPGRPALLAAGETRSWADLDRAADRGVSALRLAGLRPGDRVIVSMQTSPGIIAALFAVARAGMVAVPIGPSRPELDAVVRTVGARGAIGDQPVITAEVIIRLASVDAWWEAPSDHTERTEPETPQEAVSGGEDIAVLAGAAAGHRPVMLSHRAILAAVAAIASAPSLHLRSDDRVILVLPTYHLAGWVTAVLPLCTVGAAAVIPDPPTAGTTWVESVLATIRSQRVTVVPGAPSLYRRLTKAVGVERALSSVRLMTSGAAPLDPGDASAIRALTGQAVWEGYGVSESASVVSTSLMTRAARTGSVGLPLPGLELRIVGDDGADLNAKPDEDQPEEDFGSDDPGADAGVGGEVGRVQISGATLFSGYWPDGAGGAGDSGWFGTKDLGYLDDVGELHLVDRAAETVRIAGFTVYPREIEDVLTGHPYVRDAAVIGAPGRAGEAVVAVLVPLWGTHPTTADLDEFVAQRLPVFKRPQRYLLVDRLPRNEIGRVDRRAVGALYGSEKSSETVSSPPAESAELAAEVLLVDDADESADLGPVDRDDPGPPVVAVVAPDVTPEAAAPLDELGRRLPRTGGRDRRGNDDTDDDLF